MILYESDHKKVRHQLGTSGFLYRSDKLMFDEATHSLWNTLQGRPVVGPLVGKGIELKRRSVVTTTWGEWRKRHPSTTVLSLDTGFDRDYDEGVAYRAYFATDNLMFSVGPQDKRLKNKTEVLGLVFASEKDQALAIDMGFLRKNPIYSGSLGKTPFLVLTDRSGAARVFGAPKDAIVSYDGFKKAVDSKKGEWRVEEDGLKSGKETYARLPQHRAFWFGWYAAYPRTDLVRAMPARPTSRKSHPRAGK